MTRGLGDSVSLAFRNAPSEAEHPEGFCRCSPCVRPDARCRVPGRPTRGSRRISPRTASPGGRRAAQLRQGPGDDSVERQRYPFRLPAQSRRFIITRMPSRGVLQIGRMQVSANEIRAAQVCSDQIWDQQLIAELHPPPVPRFHAFPKLRNVFRVGHRKNHGTPSGWPRRVGPRDRCELVMVGDRQASAGAAAESAAVSTA